MSIFTTLPSILWTPTVTTAAPMTVAAITINLGRFGIFGQWCFFGFNITLTIGGVLAAQTIDLTLPAPSSIAAASLATVANTLNGGALNVARSGVLFGPQSMFVIKSNGVVDVAWAAGATILVGTGMYPLS